MYIGLHAANFANTCTHKSHTLLSMFSLTDAQSLLLSLACTLITHLLLPFNKGSVVL